jgi:hypothetical protein
MKRQTSHSLCVVIIAASVLICSSGCRSSRTITLTFGSPGIPGSDSANTIASIQRVDEIFCMTYSGSYDERLGSLHTWMITHTDTDFHPDHNANLPPDCSIFSTTSHSGGPFFGRNLDNPRTGILVAQYNPPGKYRSFAFSMLEDLGIRRNVLPENLSTDEKMRFLMFPYYPADGMNEKGLAVGLAGVHPQRVAHSTDRQLVHVALFICMDLDNCATVDEAVELSRHCDIFDGSLGTISHHFLVADADGNSAILKYYQGQMQDIHAHDAWQVITNIFVYDRPLG